MPEEPDTGDASSGSDAMSTRNAAHSDSSGPVAGTMTAATPEARRHPWPWTVGAVLASIVSVTTLLGFGLTRDPTVVRSALIGRPAPSFDLPLLVGKGGIRLVDLRGSVVVLNFWASWCAACKEEHPHLLAAWNRYRDSGVVFVGVDYQDSAAAAKAYIHEMGGDWPVVTDPGSRTALAYGVYGVPETFFIGHDGIVLHKQIGASSYELLTTQIERLLSRRGAQS